MNRPAPFDAESFQVRTTPAQGGKHDTALGQPLAQVRVSASASGEQNYITLGQVPAHVQCNPDGAATLASGNVLPASLPFVVPKDTSAPGTSAPKRPKLAGYTIHEYIGGGTFGDVLMTKWKDKGHSETLDIQFCRKAGKFVRSIEDAKRDIDILKHVAGEPHILRLSNFPETHFNTQLIMSFLLPRIKAQRTHMGFAARVPQTL